MAAAIAGRARRKKAESAGAQPAGARRYHCHDHQASSPRPKNAAPVLEEAEPVHFLAGNRDDDGLHLRVVAHGPTVIVRKAVPDDVRYRPKKMTSQIQARRRAAIAETVRNAAKASRGAAAAGATPAAV